MTDSIRLLEEFNKYAAKGVTCQKPQKTLDRCANAPKGDERCLLRDMLKKGSDWKEDEDQG